MLKSLSLGSFISLEEEPEAFGRVCEAWPSLETVTFTDTEVPDACLDMLATRCPRLAAVDLSCCTGFTADGIASLGQCPLRSLRLWGCDVVTDEWLEVIGSFDQLSQLNVDGCSQLSAVAVQAFRARFHLGAQTVKSVPDPAADSIPRMWDPNGFSCLGRCS